MRAAPARRTRGAGSALAAAAAALAGCAALPPPPPLTPAPAPDAVPHCAAPACSAGQAPAAQPGAFRRLALPGAEGATLLALERGARAAPLRYRVIVVPGSGCAGLEPFAARYFAGLLHARVLVLHKSGVAPDARTPPGRCPPDFVQADALDRWQADAQAALQAWQAQQAGPALPTLLVGISEGAELLPALAPGVAQLAGLVLVSASGLDPRDAGALQAARQGQAPAWEALGQLQAGPAPDSQVAQGRSLRYWRALWRWRSAQALVDGPWPLLQVWGGADALVPQQAYAAFAARAAHRAAPYCARRLPGADHGLQARDGGDGMQLAWAWVEQWMRSGQAPQCPPPG